MPHCTHKAYVMRLVCVCVCVYIYIFYKIEILLYLNLSVYVCEVPSWKLELRPLPPTSHKYLYLWSDHRTKGVRSLYMCVDTHLE